MAPGCGTPRVWSKRSGFGKWFAPSPSRSKTFPLTVTISVGVATTSIPNRQDMEALLCAADEALYRAKAAGRNRVEGESFAALPDHDPPKPSVTQ